MEYNVLNNGELVPAWPPRYLPESVPPTRPNMKVVLLPTPYQGVSEPYPSLRQGQYQEIPYPNFQSPPRNRPTLPQQGLQAQSLLEAPYNSLQDVPYQILQAAPSLGLQTTPDQAPVLSEVPYHSLQVPSHSTSQAQGLSAPVQKSIDDIFTENNTMAGGNNIQVSQDMRRTEENFPVTMTPPRLRGPVEGQTVDTLPAIAGMDTRCCSCGGDGFLKSSIEKLSSSQKQATKAWAEFANDVISDIDENKQWRISMEEKVERLLEGRIGGGASDFELSDFGI